MSFLWVFLFSLLGSIFGSVVCYYIALIFGRKLTEKFLLRYGKLFFIDESHLVKSEKYFEKHGEITIFIARLIPGIRHLISLPAGFAKMNLTKFCLYTAIGSGLWSLVLIGMGYYFGGNMDIIRANLSTITLWLGVILALILVFYIYMHRRKNNKKDNNYARYS
jgi:membrane protein DedA with SNARE-associated domain